MPPINISAVIMSIVVALVLLIIPIALAVWLWKRYGASWRYLWYGAVIYVLVQSIVISFVLSFLGSTFSPLVGDDMTKQVLFTAMLALIAGFLLEGGRYFGMRFLMREEKTWPRTMMVGTGFALSLILMQFSLTQLIGGVQLLLAAGDPNSLLNGIEQSKHAAIISQVTKLNNTPPLAYLTAFLTNLVQISLTLGLFVLILQVFRQRRWLWLLVAVGIDVVANLAQYVVLATSDPNGQLILIITVYVLLIGLGIWLMQRFYTPEDAEYRPSLSTASAEGESSEELPDTPVLGERRRRRSGTASFRRRRDD